MKKAVLVFLFLLLPSICIAETAMDAVLALKSLVKLTTNGTSYQEYASCLKEVKSEVDAYLKGDEAKQNKKLSTSISHVMGLFVYADSLFKKKDELQGLIDVGTHASPSDKKMASEYFSRFPEDKKDIAVGGVLVKQHGSKLKITAAINRIFRRATEKYATITDLMN